MRTEAVAATTAVGTCRRRWNSVLALVVTIVLLPDHVALAQSAPDTPVEVAGSSYVVDVGHHRGYPAVPWSRVPSELMPGSFERDGRATASVAGAPLELTVGSPFGRHGESVFQLTNVPYVEDGEIWVPLELLTGWLPGARARPNTVAERPADPTSSPMVPAAATEDGDPPLAYRKPGPWRVVIDAGHGGHDPGTVNRRTGAREKDITLSVARRLAGELSARGGFEPLLTRDRDEFVEVMQRPSLAVDWDADLFLSIHVDAQEGGSSARGFTTFYLGRARSDYALEVAMRENAVIELEEGSEPPNMDQLEFILGTMTRDAYREESRVLAGRIQNGLRGATGSRDRGVKPGPYYVLMTPGLLPAVLVELGFITNAGDEARLKREEVQERIARALADAIEGYLEDTGRRIETMEGRG
jgi:N-acetylmuramoyl-L-alanine amidase